MSAQRLLLGDWGRAVCDPLDVIRLVFLGGAAVAAAMDDVENSVRLGGTFLIVLFARWLSLPRLFDLGVLVGMALQAFGNALGLFDLFRYYDLVVHFADPLAIAPCIYILLAARPPPGALRDRRRRLAICGPPSRAHDALRSAANAQVFVRHDRARSAMPASRRRAR